jgi:rare lipoprotein A
MMLNFKLTGAVLLLSLAGLVAVGCGPAAKPPPRQLTEPFEDALGPDPVLEAKSTLSGASYVVRGKRYHLLASAAGYTAEGLGSWYGGRFQGRKTASGEKFDQNKMTAAHRTLPFGSLVEVRNKANGKTVVVRINDRGPFHDDYVIDLSRAAATKIGLLSSGPVAVRTIGDQIRGQ